MQFDEKWAFVYKKEKHCDPALEADRKCGDHWDHLAYDPEHRLVLSVCPGKRSRKKVRQVVGEAKRRTAGRMMRLITSDEYKPYRQEILEAYGISEPVIPTGRRGRPRKPLKKAPPDLLYATVHKTRKNGVVVKVEPRLVFGTEEQLKKALELSSVSNSVNTSFIERQNATDRHRNSRKVRKTYRFSKNWEIHDAATYFSLYSYNFCWSVRTLRLKLENGKYKKQTPAMSAGLTDHIWTIEEWATFPAKITKL
jgi:IS1 family transposase